MANKNKLEVSNPLRNAALMLNFPKHTNFFPFWWISEELWPLFLRSHFFLVHPVYFWYFDKPCLPVVLPMRIVFNEYVYCMYVCRYAYCSPGEYPAWWDGGWRIITSVFPCWCWHLWTSSEFLLPRHLCFLVMDSGAAGEGTTDHPLVHCLALNNPHSWMTPNGYHLSLDTHFTIEHLLKIQVSSKNTGWSKPCERQNNI